MFVNAKWFFVYAAMCKSLQEAPADATEGETAPAEPEGGVVTVEVEVETPTTEEPPKPAEEAPKDETPTEEAPKDETPTEEAPKDETPTEEAPKDETPAAAEGTMYNYYYISLYLS